MKEVELYARVRYAVRIEGLSERAAARRFGIDPRTVAKMMRFSVPPGYRRMKPPVKPRLGPFIAAIDGILAEDKGRPRKQHHTDKRIFERLRDEHGFTGGITIVKDYVAGWRQRAREMFVPLAHPPGHVQVDFGEAIGIIGGVECKIHFFAFDLPHSDACFVVAYPADSPEPMAEEARAYGYVFPYLFDEDQTVARQFRAACTPDFYLFDAGGLLAYRGQFDDSRPSNGKPVTGRDLRDARDAVLAAVEAAIGSA